MMTHPNAGGLWVEFSVGKLVAFRDWNQLVHPGQNPEIFTSQSVFVADHADDRDLFAHGQVGFQSFFLYQICDPIHRLLRRMGFHYDNH